MKYHPITDTIDRLPQQLKLLDSAEFKHIYPSLDEYLNQIESSGVNARKDLKLLLRFLTNVIGNSIGTQTRFRNEAERFMLFCWTEKNISVLNADVEVIRKYIDWIWSPPKLLISDTTRVP